MANIASRFFADSRLALAAFAALSAAILGTALASQYFGGLAPCKLCIYQRWPYGIVIALGVAGNLFPFPIRLRLAALALCGFAFAAGTAIAVYHAGVEQGWFPGPTACTGAIGNPQTLEELRRALMAAPVVRCDEIPWSLFGISLAGYNALVSAVLTCLAAAAAYRGMTGRMT